MANGEIGDDGQRQGRRRSRAIAGPRSAFCFLAALAASSGVCGPYGPAPPPASKTTPVEQSIALYKDVYRHGVPAPCPPAKAGEVVVCGSGRGGSTERVPLPDERGPRDGPRTAVGEMPKGTEALTMATERCGPNGCGGQPGINLLTVPFRAIKIVHGLIDRDWASDHPDAPPAADK